MNRSRATLGCSAVALIISAGLLIAGPLNPPAGPVTPTYKTLTEVEPRIAINSVNTPGDSFSLYRISQPGSYYLTGDIIGAPGKHGIGVIASNVTIDLNGFSIIGVPESYTGVFALSGVGTMEGVELTNGVIRGWPSHGINFTTNNIRSSVIRNVRSLNNGSIGIWTASQAKVIDCVSRGNGLDGINVGSDSTITNSHATSNGRAGIDMAASCIATGCSSSDNGADGYSTTSNAVITNCIARNNTQAGFNLGLMSRVLQSSSSENNTYGFLMGSVVCVSECSGRDNAVGAVRISGANANLNHNTLTSVSGFPAVTIDSVGGVRIADNVITGGTVAVQSSSLATGLLISNNCIGQSGVMFNVGSGFQVGPTVNVNGPINTTSPFTNFSR